MNLADVAKSSPRLRGPQTIIGSDEKEYKIFVCHGCQSCWGQDPDTGRFHEYYPHILSMEVVHKVTRISL